VKARQYNYTFFKVSKMCRDSHQHSIHSEMTQKNNEDQSALIREVSRPGLRRMEQQKMQYAFVKYGHYLTFTYLLPFVE
jgi:hypothetical protein